jgi:hypothetical protein
MFKDGTICRVPHHIMMLLGNAPNASLCRLDCEAGELIEEAFKSNRQEFIMDEPCPSEIVE